MFDGVNWGNGTKWSWQDAVRLCKGSQRATWRVRCFKNRVGQGASQDEAIDACATKSASLVETAMEIVNGSGQCISAVGNAYNHGAPVIAGRCNSRELRQRWVHDGQRIINTSGLCLTTSGTLNGAYAGLRPCRSNKPTQQWRVAGGRLVSSAGTNMCLGLVGANAKIVRCGEASTQNWSLRHHPSGIQLFRASPSRSLFAQCAIDVRSQVQNLARFGLGKKRGTNFYVRGARSTDGKNHIQGVARLGDKWAAYTDKGGLYVVEFPQLGGVGLEAWVTNRGNGAVRQTINIEPPFDHYGGLQAVNGAFLAVPIMGHGKAGVALYDFAYNGGLTRRAFWDTARLSANAHYAGMADKLGGGFFLAVGNDDRTPRGPHKIYLYTVDRLDRDSTPRYLAYWDRGRVRNDYQSISLIKECDSGQLYVLGMGAKGAASRTNYIELNHLRAYYPNGNIERLEVADTYFRAEGNDCNPDGGSSFHVTPNGKLVYYCAEKDVKGSEFTIREYR